METISDIEIIRSLLYCFQGVNSHWIEFNQNEKQFVVKAQVCTVYIFISENVFIYL